MLGQHWLDGFLKRNSTVAIRTAESLSQASASGLNAAVVDGWFNELRESFVDYKSTGWPKKVSHYQFFKKKSY